MAITPIKALLFLAGGTAAAGATAYVAGALDPYLPNKPAVVATLPPEGEADTKGNRLPAAETPSAPAEGSPPAAAPPSAATPPAANPPAVTPPVSADVPGKPADAIAPASPADSAAAPAPAVQPPTFDVVRVEGDGSVVIAGKAAPNAKIEILSGSNVIGQTTAGPDGDFAVVLDTPLKPGSYQIVLRSTAPDSVVAMSVETAILSIPDKPDGQVLAMVEEPGKPAELLSVPQPQKPAEATPPATAETPAVPATASEQPADPATAAGEPAPPAVAPPAAGIAGPRVVVEAVEIEGSKIFVAGAADAGQRVRGYANDMLLGDAIASADGRFLIEADKDLSVGNYIIRVDLIGKDGATVVARAAVPFDREPGEAIAAVAPSEPATPPTTGGALATPPASSDAPPAVAPPATEPPATGLPAAGADGASAPPAPADSISPPASAAPPSGGQAAVSPPVPSVPAPAEGVDIAAAPPASATPPAAGAPEVTAPKLQSVNSAVIIRRGDTLWRISRRVYGKGVRYSTIYLANQEQIQSPHKIFPGQVFKVPDTSKEGEAADMTTIKDQATTVPQAPSASAPAAVVQQ